MLIAVAVLSMSAAEPEIAGLWATGDDGGRVRIETCGDAICGRLVAADALEDDPDLKDVNHPDPDMRDRPLQGVPVIQDFTRDETGQWVPGVLYDPEEGRVITRGHLELVGEDRLEVRGCVAFICQTQEWARIDEAG